jgi:DNA-directed RNA polymerase specialized sigma24 family protein
MTRDDQRVYGEAARRGDASAADRLLLSVRGFIHLRAMQHADIRNTHPRMAKVDADDLASEYAVKVLQSLRAGAFDPSRASLTTYVGWKLRSLHNHAIQDERRLCRDVGREVSGDMENDDGKTVFDSVSSDRRLVLEGSK